MYNKYKDNHNYYLYMSQLDLLKTHIENMDTRIKTIESEINEKKQLIINFENQKNEIILNFEKQKNEIEFLLNNENDLYSKLVENYNYLCEVKQNTSSNYKQLEDAATTLLDILRNKCDGI
jgi:hypothetical protein